MSQVTRSFKHTIESTQTRAAFWILSSGRTRCPSRPGPFVVGGDRAPYDPARAARPDEPMEEPMKYMLMYWDSDTTEYSVDEVMQMTVLKSWIDEMRRRGIRLVRARDGERLVSDGPFAETKDQIGGYDVIECASLDEAIEVAAAHPLAQTATVEVRPFDDFPWPE